MLPGTSCTWRCRRRWGHHLRGADEPVRSPRRSENPPALAVGSVKVATILGFIYLLAGFMMFAAMQTILLDTDIGDAIAALVLTLLLIGAALPFFGHAHAA